MPTQTPRGLPAPQSSNCDPRLHELNRHEYVPRSFRLVVVSSDELHYNLNEESRKPFKQRQSFRCMSVNIDLHSSPSLRYNAALPGAVQTKHAEAETFANATNDWSPDAALQRVP
jgi:hypothetical protein